MANPNILNATSIYGKTLGANLTTTTNTDILICPANKLIKVNTIMISNIDGTNNVDVTVYVADGGSFRWNLASTITVAAKSTLALIGKDNPIYLTESWQIEAGASAAADAQIIISYDELDDA